MTVGYKYYLAHHGIKGQQWGKRRWQNEDGSLTPEGRIHYGVGERDQQQYRMEENQTKNTQKLIQKQISSGKEKSERRKQLEEEYLKKGLTKEQAEAEAFNRERIEKVFKVAAGVAITAAIAYGAYRGIKHINRFKDVKIKAGETFQRIAKDANEDKRFAVYATPDAKDKVKYRGIYGAQLFNNQALEGNANPKVHQLEFDAQRKMRIAGERSGKKVFNQLMKNDPSFAKDVHESEKWWKAQGWEQNIKDNYERFNQRLVDHNTDEGKRASSRFYKELQKKGYDGVVDINDRHYSGYRSKKPVILFNRENGVGNYRSRELAQHEIERSYNAGFNAIQKEMKNEERTKKLLKATGRIGISSAGVAVATAASIPGRNSVISNTKARQNKLVEQYKDEHPNTMMSDQQILDRIYGYKRR